jgi:hypothetical protein
VLAPAKIAVVLQRALVEFVSTIVELLTSVSERVHLVGGERLKIAQDRQILVEDLHGIDAADGRGNGETHGIRKCFSGSERALRDELARSAHALHSENPDAASIGNGQDVGFKAAEPGVQWIERHLDHIESIAAVEHLQIDSRMLMSVESHEADLPLLLCPGKGCENTVTRVDHLGVIVVDDLMNLPDVQMIGLQTGKRRIQHAHCSVLVAAMRTDGAHHDDFVSFAFESDSKLLFAEASMKLPGIVENVDPVVDGFGNHIVHLSLISNGAEMEAAHAQDGALKAGATQWTPLRLEAAQGDFVAGFDCRGHLRSWKHGGHSCYRGTFQEASPAYLWSDFGVVVSHHSSFLNLGPCVACVIWFLDHVLDLDLRRVERVVVDQPGFGIVEFKGNFVHLETSVRGILATTVA